MPDAVRELFHLAAPVAIAVDDAESSEPDMTRVVVKGFASVMSKNDRSGDLVPPEEFRIEQFMAAPTLLVNHKLWIDMMGNGVGVGRPLEMYAARLDDLGERDQKNWGIFDLKTKTVVARFPRAKVPNLKKGDRGLFVVAEVTEPEVVKRVRAGELSAFSWRGLTSVEYEVDRSTGMTRRVFRDIDLYEISLTHVPDNPDSTFVIGKSVDGKFVEEEVINENLALYRVTLEKSRFESADMAKAYATKHGLAFDNFDEDEYAFHAPQQRHLNFDLERLASIKMADGVRMVVGPVVAEDTPASRLAWLAERVELSKSTNEGASDMATEATKEAAEAAAEATSTDSVKTEAEKAGKMPPTADAKKGKDKEMVEKDGEGKTEAAKASDQLEALGGIVAKNVVEGLTPAFAEMTNVFKSGLTEIASKMAAGVGSGEAKTEAEKSGEVVEPDAGAEAAKAEAEKSGESKETDTETDAETDAAGKTEAAKSADLSGLGDLLGGLMDGMKQLQTAVTEVQKSNAALAKATPAEVNRDEKIEAEKSADKDENACFDGLWPFVG